MQNEFDLINYLKNLNKTHSKFIHTGIGDDAAIIDTLEGYQLVSSIDTSISGVHFPKETSAADIGYKSLAVSLSDMAAMGAEPIGILLALTLPDLNETWIQNFAQGFFELANEFKVPLIGGDTTQGPLSISTVLHGLVPKHQALLRSGAKVGDLICVSGYLGEAGLALQEWRRGKLTNADLKKALNRPYPRVALGLALREIASSAIDISDGLVQDLGRILTASRVGAEIKLENLPLSSLLTKTVNLNDAQQLALSAGDDYELCFTLNPKYQDQLLELSEKLKLKLSIIGKITQEPDLKIYNSEQQCISMNHLAGYQHFKGK